MSDEGKMKLSALRNLRTAPDWAQVYATLELADAVRDHAEVMREMLDDTNAEIRNLAEAVQGLD